MFDDNTGPQQPHWHIQYLYYLVDDITGYLLRVETVKEKTLGWDTKHPHLLTYYGRVVVCMDVRQFIL